MTALNSENVEELRGRLASRPSFFGGTVSTRLLSAAPGWKPPTPPPTSKATGGNPHQNRAGINKAGDNAAPNRGALQIGRRQERKRMAQDFTNLDDDSAPSSTPPPSMPKLGDRAVAALAAMDKMRAKPHSSMQSLPLSAAGPKLDLPSPSSTTKRGTVARVVLPKGKKGAAARVLAVAPQGQGGLTGRQAADKLMQEKVAELRSRRGTPPLDTTRGVGRLEEAQGRSRSAPAQLPPAKRRRDTMEDDLVVDAEDEEEEEDWRAQMRSITGYDPSRYGREADDRAMVASRSQIEAEERRSLRAGRAEDAADIEAEARLRAAKAAKKARLQELRTRQAGAG